MKILNKNIFREFKFSIARFVSITTLLALGVFILIGLKVTGNDMRVTANNYYESHKMADAIIKSNSNISISDQTKLKKLKHIKTIEFTKSIDGLIANTDTGIRIQEKTSKLSTYQVTSGQLPLKADEIALSVSEHGKYKIGDYIKLKNKNNKKISELNKSKYRIVGFVTSSDYLLKQNLGVTSVGTGQINTYAVVAKSAFISDTPTTALISYDNVKGSSYSNGYEKKVEQNVVNSESRIQQIVKIRKEKIINASYAKIDAQLPILQKTYGDNASLMITKEKTQVNTKVDALTYQIQSRNDYNDGYNQFGEDAKRIDVLSNTFPIIFFAVAILVVLLTMSRMGEEKRIELGTLRALGYTKHDTMKVFLLYGFLASIIGTSIGAWLGTTFLPKKIFTAYAANFVIPDFQTPISWKWIVISLVITTICTILPAVYVAGKSLKEKPATLMLPKPPKTGSKIILERLPFIWKKLSFNYKVTLRNLFRYKFKSFMTVIGIMGCTALLITGFGIKDSLNNIVNTQYKDIIHYDLIGMYNPTDTTKNIDKYKNRISNINGLKNKTTIYYENVTSKNSSMTSNQQISLIVPKHESQFDTYVTLRNPNTSKKVELSNNGAVITQKLAKIMNVTIGDNITIKTTSGQKYRVKISNITEMYAGHDIYMNSIYYNKIFKQAITYNSIMMNFKNRSASNIDKISRQLTTQHASVTVVQSDDAKQTINNILNGLNNLVLIIIIAASLLAFVVLFTLTNINVSERIRELSTIKVLGFYPMEVVMYIYRETFILTLLGIILGFIGGSWLHNYIMQTLPPETAMADMTLFWTNFTLSGSMTIIFSIVVMIFMARKIRKVDMLEALKSVD
ncbi:ABC transporter permease [Companilactobacillus jidongensis]|uniref:ABC transporter permease n=1 Tax=Companilactobacillus jidongensis TaxID=2486006 RepID=UPI000F76CA26|nr:ABC transporter permease [Companilactobacillus jidongensis]